MQITNSTALILVHHGASTNESIKGYQWLKNSVIALLKADCDDLLIEEAFLNQRYAEQSSVTILDIESVLSNLFSRKISCVYVQPSLLVPGQQYRKLIQILDKWRDKFEHIVIGEALLSDVESCSQLAELVNDYFSDSADTKKILIAHGGVNEGNKWLSVFNNQLCTLNSQFQLIELSRSKNVQDLGNILRSNITDYSSVKIIPFMLILGHHFYNDIVLATQIIDSRIQLEVFDSGLSELRFLHLFMYKKIKLLLSIKHDFNAFSQR